MTMFLRDTPGRTCIHNENFCSVAIVSFNRHGMLRKAIDSVHQYADMPFELVVSDDGGVLYNDFNFIQEIRDKVSHIAVNLGANKGLHVNTNTAVSLTRSKYVMVIYDDVEIQRPFMRDSVSVLEAAPYVGTIYLGNNYLKTGRTDDFDSGGILQAAAGGVEFGLVCAHGGSWASAFRKDYWYEVGGYSEDDIYGDLPFVNKGWQRGYFSCILEGDARAKDMDKDVHGRTHNSTGTFIEGSYTNYPKLFGVEMDDQNKWGIDRHRACALRNHDGRQDSFGEFSGVDWHEYMKSVVSGGNIDWELLKSRHSRFIGKIKKNIHSRYPRG